MTPVKNTCWHRPPRSESKRLEHRKLVMENNSDPSREPLNWVALELRPCWRQNELICSEEKDSCIGSYFLSKICWWKIASHLHTKLFQAWFLVFGTLFCSDCHAHHRCIHLHCWPKKVEDALIIKDIPLIEEMDINLMNIKHDPRLTRAMCPKFFQSSQTTTLSA